MKTKLLVAALCIAAYSNAQITTYEQPYGVLMKEHPLIKNVTVQKEVKTITAAHKAMIAQEDLINDAEPGPVRYAFNVSADYTLENSGTWQTLEDSSRLWRLKVEMPGALSTNTYYDRFWLPEGAKFFVYSEETGQFIGAITSGFIEGSREEPIEFATALIYGESVVFEYYQPASVEQQAIIDIARIDYGYRFVNNPYQSLSAGFGESLPCEININCPEGESYQKEEKHAVARVAIWGPNGSGWCSCALVNNSSNNYTPYVLTANHCISGKGLDAITNNNASQCVFYWEYERSGCSNTSSAPLTISTTGATVVANGLDSDFALFQLTQDPRNNSLALPYYLGWSRSTTVSNNAVVIHHPAGDVKKISQINQITSTDTHWQVNVYNGTTEQGSSGSSLLNSNHKVIGQLHYGGNGCAPITDYYGRFDISWTGNGATDSRRRLKDRLDPANTNPQEIAGLAYSASNIFFTGYVQQSGCACVPSPEKLWFNQYQDGPLYVCAGAFTIYFRSNKTNLSFSYSGSGTYNFSNQGSGNYQITGTFPSTGNMVFFSFTSGSTTTGMSFSIGCNTAASPSAPIAPGAAAYDPQSHENKSTAATPESSDTPVHALPGAIVVQTGNDTQVYIYNTNGQIVARQPVSAGTTRINIPAGWYFVTLNNSSYKILVR